MSVQLIDLFKDVLLSIGGATIILFGLSSWLGKVWANRILNKEKTALTKEVEIFKADINSNINLKLEEYKRELDIKYSDISHRRLVYERLSELIEEILLGNTNTDYALKVNKIFGLLAIYAPDDVYEKVKEALPIDRFADVRDIKPILYSALRKDILKEETSIEQSDIAPHFAKFHSGKK